MVTIVRKGIQAITPRNTKPWRGDPRKGSGENQEKKALGSREKETQRQREREWVVREICALEIVLRRKLLTILHLKEN